MRLRTRLTVAVALAVALVVAASSVFAYVFVRHQLLEQVDRSLAQRVDDVQDAGPYPTDRYPAALNGPEPGETGTTVQFVTADGTRLAGPDQRLPLPVTPDAVAVAAGARGRVVASVEVGDTRLRVRIEQVQPGLAAEVYRPLNEFDRELAHTRSGLLLFALGGVLLAVLLGLLIARAGLAPVARLTEAAEHLARTRDLTLRISPGREDEIGRLADSLNAMLVALEESVAAQRQLVADASHELRTPVTSLRTNLEVLARDQELSPAARERLRRDLVAQLDELTGLVGDVVELARGEEPEQLVEDVPLDRLVEHAVTRARRHWPQVAFTFEAVPALVSGVPARLDRAVTNLLANAAAWSPSGSTVRVTVEVAGGAAEVCVADHGPGIAIEDRPHVFDRFYRSAAAREKPGSGLGLAIVRQVAESHHGEAQVDCPDDGGTVMTLRLPLAD